MIIFDIIVCTTLLIIGYNLKNWIHGFSAYEKSVLNILFIWHLLVGIGYLMYLDSSGGGDVYMYWDYPQIYGWELIEYKIQKGSASGYMYLLTYTLSEYIGLSFFTGSLIGSQLGYLSFVLLLKLIKENIPNYQILKHTKILGVPIFPYILFMPNIHFWTSGLGKDVIIFFSIVAFIYALFKWRSRFFLILLSFLLIFLIRPHILLFLLLSVGMAAFWDGKMKLYQKMAFVLVFFACIIIMLPKVMEFAQLDSFDAEAIETYSSSKASALNKEGSGSGIDISNYPYPLKVFTFLFRPLFIDMTGVLGIVSSIENLILLIIFFKVIKNKPIQSFTHGNLTIKTIIIFFIIGSMIFSLILGNLGIMLRQKNPFITMLIVYAFWVISRGVEMNSKFNKKKKVSLSLR